MDLPKEYLFPVPGSSLRKLLNSHAELIDLKHQQGEADVQFSVDMAALDIMLDMDRVDRGEREKLRPIRWYAERWKWSKTQVARGVNGDAARNQPAFLTERAAAFRSFYATEDPPWDGVGTAGDTWGQLGTECGLPDIREADLGTAGDKLGTAGDSNEQTHTHTHTHPPTGAHAHAREDETTPAKLLNDAYAALPEIHPWAGFRVPIQMIPKVNATVTDLQRWRETIQLWTETEYSPRNVNNLLDHYSKGNHGKGTGKSIRAVPSNPRAGEYDRQLE